MGLLPGSDNGIERLTITSHKMIDCSDSEIESFVLQVNPENLTYEFGISTNGGGENGEAETGGFGGGETAAGASAPPPGFKGYNRMTLEFKFYADATGIVPIGEDISDYFEEDPPSIRPYLDLLQNTVYGYEPESHGPPYLKLVWGYVFPDTGNDNKEKKPAVFKGQLEKCTVKILLFSLKGEPVKAEIDLQIKSIVAPDARPLGNSPDVTHNVPIGYGDKMTTICNEIYGRFDSKICSAVAAYNGLVNWDLQDKVGKQLVFPSIHLLNEEYIEEWDQLEQQQKEKEAEAVYTHFDHMASLIGEKKAKQYFKTFDFDPAQPYEEWQQSYNETKGYA